MERVSAYRVAHRVKSQRVSSVPNGVYFDNSILRLLWLSLYNHMPAKRRGIRAPWVLCLLNSPQVKTGVAVSFSTTDGTGNPMKPRTHRADINKARQAFGGIVQITAKKFINRRKPP